MNVGDNGRDDISFSSALDIKSHPDLAALNLECSALLLDVDGTLLDIKPTPGEVHASAALIAALERLFIVMGGAVALVSGRLISDLDRIFAPLRLPTIGGHGVEIRLGGTGHPIRQAAGELDPALRQDLTDIARSKDGILIEDKGFSLAIHYRLAPDQEPMIQGALDEIFATHDSSMIELLAGKSVIEVKQSAFDKGKAVRELMRRPPFEGRRPLFIGDDVTDEAAFAVMPEFSGLAYSVSRSVPGAMGSFPSPHAVRTWLCSIAEAPRPQNE